MKKLLFFVCIIGLLASCRSVRVNKSFKESSIDSSSHEIIENDSSESESIFQVNTGEYHETMGEDSSNKTELAVEFYDEFDFDVTDTANKVKAEDYVTIDSTGTIKISGPRIKSVKYKETTKKTKDVEHFEVFHDSTTSKVETTTRGREENKTTVKKEEESGSKDRRTCGFSTLGNILIFIGGLLVVIYFVYFRKRKKPF